MKKIKRLTIIAVFTLAIFGFASCTKDDDKITKEAITAPEGTNWKSVASKIDSLNIERNRAVEELKKR